MPRIWSFLWRGGIGGFLGLVVFAVYLFFFDTYRLNGLGIAALVATLNGLLIGALVFFLGRVLRRDFGFPVRIIVGIVFSFCSMALYSYLAGGFYGDLKWFLTNVILLAVTFGGLAGALASEKSRKEFPKEDHVERSADDERTQPWSFLWRGAIGGTLGGVALIIYRFLTSPLPLSELLIAVLISAVNGFFVGAFIWFLGRWLSRAFGLALRIIAGVLFSICSIAFYLYVGGLNGDIKLFIVNALTVGLMLGVPAGAIAKGKTKVCKFS